MPLRQGRPAAPRAVLGGASPAGRGVYPSAFSTSEATSRLLCPVLGSTSAREICTYWSEPSKGPQR